jgi:hypothetical protein
MAAILGSNNLEASADTYVPLLLPNRNFGSEKVLVISNALIQFDQAAVAATVPPGAAVMSARLEVTIDAALTLPLKAGSTIGAFRMTHAWTESGATFNCAVDANVGNAKADCSGGDAWKMGGSSPSAWASPATGTVPIVTGETGVLSFDVTSDVKGFLSGALSNFGWLLRSDALTGAAVLAIGSRESDHSPHLVVTLGCAPGFADCDHVPSNGCEQPLSSVGNCRVCGASCDDANPCTVDVCDAVTGCKHVPAGDGTACDDHNACTRTDSCQAGVCTGVNPVSCGASDQCHAPGTCDPASGVCSNPTAAESTACDDGDPCTQTDRCQAGACVGSNPVVCAAADQCHLAGVCDAATGLCSNPPAADGTACSDGNACTRTDSCQSGVCAGSDPVVCPASDQCHAPGTCDTTSGICSDPAAADGSGCNDGNACTRTDSCQAGACVGGDPVICTAIDQCHAAGVCDAGSGVCSNPAVSDGTACDGGTCAAGQCASACKVQGQVCSADADCCSGACALIFGFGKRCTAPGACAGAGAACDRATDCCSLSCRSGQCTEATDSCSTCLPSHIRCVSDSECCNGHCATVAAGSSLRECADTFAGCSDIGDWCFLPTDCCSGSCPVGQERCSFPNACRPLGESCSVDGDCCADGQGAPAVCDSGTKACRSAAASPAQGGGSPCVPGSTRACSKQSGVCHGSVMTCAPDGTWPADCDYTTIPNYSIVERCDGLDNNCNGIVDLDGFPDKGQSCFGVSNGACLIGTIVCSSSRVATICNVGASCPDFCVGGACAPDHCSSNADCPSGTQCDSDLLCGDGECAPVSPTLSTVVALPTQVVADGAASSMITVKIADVFGRPFPGAQVTLAPTPNVGVVVVQPPVTDANGVATGRLSATLAQTFTVTATAPGAVTLVQKPAVTFAPGAFSSVLSTMVANPSAGVPANGTATSTIIVTVRDAQNNPVPGVFVSFLPTGTGNIIVQPPPTNASGTTSATIASTVAETKTIFAIAQNQSFKSVTVTFVPPP